MDQLQNYINQLLADLKAAQPTDSHIAPADEFGGVEAYLSANYYSMKTLTGIDAIQFPPAGRLNTQQQKALIEAILALWVKFYIAADYPVSVPANLLYSELVNAWAKERFPLLGGQGTFHLEFCEYIPEKCPWGLQFCQCKEFMAEEPAEEVYNIVQQRVKNGYENLIQDIDQLDDEADGEEEEDTHQ